MADGSEGKKYFVIDTANQIKQHLAYLRSAFWSIWAAMHQVNECAFNKAEFMEVFQSYKVSHGVVDNGGFYKQIV